MKSLSSLLSNKILIFLIDVKNRNSLRSQNLVFCLQIRMSRDPRFCPHRKRKAQSTASLEINSASQEALCCCGNTAHSPSLSMGHPRPLAWGHAGDALGLGLGTPGGGNGGAGVRAQIETPATTMMLENILLYTFRFLYLYSLQNFGFFIFGQFYFNLHINSSHFVSLFSLHLLAPFSPHYTHWHNVTCL